jgi:hypothetical protein
VFSGRVCPAGDGDASAKADPTRGTGTFTGSLSAAHGTQSDGKSDSLTGSLYSNQWYSLKCAQ